VVGDRHTVLAREAPGDALRDQSLRIRIAGGGDHVVGALTVHPPHRLGLLGDAATIVGHVGELAEDEIGLETAERLTQTFEVEDVADDRLGTCSRRRSAFAGVRVSPATSCPASTSKGTRRAAITPLAPSTKTLTASP
jgi:hypothetical protein